MGNQIGKRRAAGSGGQALDQIAVLGGVGNAIERAEGFTFGAAGIGGARFVQRFGVAHDDGVECRRGVGAIVGINARQIGLHQFHGSGLAGFEGGAQLGDGDFGDFDHRVTC